MPVEDVLELATAVGLVLLGMLVQAIIDRAGRGRLRGRKRVVIYFNVPRGDMPFRATPFFTSNIWSMLMNTNLPVGQTVIGTGVIVDANDTPVPGAVPDAPFTWTTTDATIATIEADDLTTATLTAVAAGNCTVNVAGTYLGQLVAAEASVTITAVEAGFAMNVEWGTPSKAAR